ncbi:nucleotidyltransferase domain-containing protein [bacterium]|nr:nucleotidyltransferase domain-containing protein [bacterium]
MPEKIYSTLELKDILLPIIRKYNAQKAYIFGSYARNEADMNSDIDVLVIGGKLFDPTDIFCIAEELYTASQKKVDVYEESEIDRNSDLYSNIMREGIEVA